ncbi:MAG: hypothetical protein R3E79_42165 [Caldilineaceae bacterium]
MHLAITRTEKEIDLLRVIPYASIADVVTGKLDVRQAAAGLPEEVEEPEPLEDEADIDADASADDLERRDRGGSGMTTDTSERGLERLICTALTGALCDTGAELTRTLRERPATYGAGWICGDPHDYDREYCVDLVQLTAFFAATQPDLVEALELQQDGPTRRKFLARLQGEITKRGTIDVLRNGIKHGPHHLDLFYGTLPRQPESAGTLHGQPLQRHPPVPLQSR